MPPIEVKFYDEMPEFRHRYRPDDWPADEEYHEVFALPNGNWFAVIEDPQGGNQRSSGKATQDEAEAEIFKHVRFIREFWDQKVEWANNGDKTTPHGRDKGGHQVVRIGGHHYVISPDPTDHRPGQGDGHGGREFHIRLFGQDKVIVTHNMWAQGKIPEEYRAILPDNAEDVTPSIRTLFTTPATFL
jgi:hypothetical protein